MTSLLHQPSLASDIKSLCKSTNGEPCEWCAELKELEREGMVASKDLAIRRSAVGQKINTNHALILRFPVEIASRIFSFCLPEPRSYGKMPFNLVLGSICREWREIAWTTPHLWTTLLVKLHCANILHHTELTEEWLNRSGQMLLDVIVFDADLNKPSSTPMACLPLLSIVNGCSSRWRSLDLSIPTPVYPYILGDESGAPLLDRLSLFPTSWFPIPGNKSQDFSLKNVTPSPSKLTLVWIYPSSINIEWAKLTHVQVYNLPVKEVITLFQLASCMVDCDIDYQDGNSYRSYNAFDLTPVVHRALRSITFGVFFTPLGPSILNSLLDHLSLPCLSKLDCDLDNISPDVFSSFVQHSCCQLTSLVVWDSSGDPSKLMQLVSTIPTLTDLDYCGDVDDSFFDWMVVAAAPVGEETEADQNKRKFLPILHSLTLQTTMMFSWSAFAAIFAARPLTIVRMEICSEEEDNPEEFRIDDQVARSLRSRNEEGYDIRIHTRVGPTSSDLITWSLDSDIVMT